MADEKKDKEKELKEDEETTEKATVSEEDLLKAIDELENIVKAKSRDYDDEEDEDEWNEDEEDFEDSVTSNFDEDETIEKAVEVSPFLEALVDQTETSLQALGREISKLKKSAAEFDYKYVNSLKQISEMLKALDERLKRIEETPVSGPKSIRKAAVIEKSFAGTGQVDEIDQLPKRKVIDLLEKAVVDGKIKDTVLIAYESEMNYPLTAEQKDILKSYLR